MTLNSEVALPLWVIFALVTYSSSDYDYEYPSRHQASHLRRPIDQDDSLELDISFFENVETYYVNADDATEKEYPWIARVIHSRRGLYPHVCTAVCIEKRIFITSARCILYLKVKLTSVIYQTVRFSVKTFVVPSEPSKQMFDDIGFIVTNPGTYNRAWPAAVTYAKNRTDVHFWWFHDLNLHQKPEHKVIGYATRKHYHKYITPETKYDLKQLPVVLNPSICHKLYAYFSKGGFFVPCYSPCVWLELKANNKKCSRYLAAEGAAIYNFKTKVLLGLVTWAVYNSELPVELPGGFAVPNSENYYKDRDCARTVRDDTEKNPTWGYYQGICDLWVGRQMAAVKKETKKETKKGKKKKS